MNKGKTMKKIKLVIIATALMGVLSVSYASTLPTFSITGSTDSISLINNNSENSSVVPVPVAGVIFASLLFAAGSLGRRKKKSKKSVIIGAFARSS